MSLDTALASVLVAALTAVVTLWTQRAARHVQARSVAVADKAEARQEAQTVVDGALDLVTGIRAELERLQAELVAERQRREQGDARVRALHRRVELLEDENSELRGQVAVLRRRLGEQ